MGGLEPNTGWCYTCAKEITDLQRKCIKCNSPLSCGGWLCGACKFNSFLEQHADRIEYHVSMGMTVTNAISRIREEVRPICIVCKKQINGAKQGAVFCRTTSECRRYSRRYTYLYRERGLTKATALADILIQLN